MNHTDMNDDRYFKVRPNLDKIRTNCLLLAEEGRYSLIHHLRNEYGIFSLGTVKSNRLRGYQTLLLCDKTLAKKGRGASQQLVCNQNKLAVVKWSDNEVITLASSYVDSHPK
ncbi:putative ankyrin 2,3/unc44 [Operophtera brumata]|uniref:Putative ankyrin 2,3/unc44 n=1 Tax=Operophtera brumata TaxID=104452 RepID=A0A0L7K4A5_OPEBR|nr:putative ankyrin 2,3/unc44 [Operophtera brumata]